MFDTPVEGLYVWIGLAAVAATTLTVAAGLPTEPPPAPAQAAATVDGVAGSDTPASATHALAADRVRVSPDGLTVRTDDATATAQFLYGPVVVAGDGALPALARGVAPRQLFDSPSTLRQAATAARERAPEWQSGSRLRVARVVWGSVAVTVVDVQ